MADRIQKYTAGCDVKDDWMQLLAPTVLRWHMLIDTEEVNLVSD